MAVEGNYPWEMAPNVVAGSDGAGTVLSVGKKVTRFVPGDKVVTTLFTDHLAGPVTPATSAGALGTAIDGTLRTHGIFDEQGLVRMPEGLSFVEASTLSCAGVTAWNAVFGLPGREPKPGHWVLTQGTGGVSLFALQFAKAAGARVIATTGSDEKIALLKKLGADHVINYRQTPDWGKTAKEITGGRGVDLVVEVGGPATLAQSVESIRLEGTMSILGAVSGITQDQGQPRLLDAWLSLFTARGLWLGNREQMEAMCAAIEADVERLRPVVDPNVFTLDQLKEAYEYLGAGKHTGKVGIKISE